MKALCATGGCNNYAVANVNGRDLCNDCMSKMSPTLGPSVVKSYEVDELKK